VSATNAIGEGPQSSVVGGVTSSQSPILAWIVANPWLMVAICCGSAAVLIVLIVVGCMIRRRYKLKKEEKENFSHNQYGLEEIDNVYNMPY